MTIIRKMTEEQRAMLHLVDEARKQIEAGTMKTIGVIAVMEKGPAWVMAGRDASSLFLATSMMQDEIKDKLRHAGDEMIANAVSPIIKPRVVS